MTAQEAKEWDIYRAIDLLKRIKREEIHERYIDRHKTFDLAIQALEEVERYRALGTVEELKEAREKQIPKKPIDNECPICEEPIPRWDSKYCSKCGQRLGEEGETSD